MKERLAKIAEKLMPPPNTEKHSSIIEREVFAKEEWFRAFYEGNSLIPFTGEGIELCFAIETILKEEEIDWEEFSISVLSPKQISFLSDAMNAQHRHKGIAVSTADQAGKFEEKHGSTPRIIKPERFKGLWQGYKSAFLTMVVQYIRHSEYVTENIQEQVVQIKKFFNNTEKNRGRLEQFKKALDIIDTILHSPEIQNLLREYREEAKSPDPQTTLRVKWLINYQPKMKAALASDLTTAFEGNLPKEIAFLINMLGWMKPFD